ncbi:MAG: protein kinase [Eubacteriales bacterium]|nr:protein kinase [Eubacteriales bacterium]
MNIEEHLAISYYEKIGTLNEEHDISIVQHRSSKKLFLKKQISIYNKSVYEYLRDHPVSFMPKIYDLCEENGKLTIIEEYISGETMEEILEKNGPLPLNTALSYFFPLCKIVSNLHENEIPIIHRDIKPSNIIITPSDVLYLLDLDAAKFVSREKTEDTVLLGTRGFAAPEQYGIGDSSSDEHTDIFALGITLKFLLFGYDKKDLSNHPLEPVIKKSTKLEANLRYHSVNEMINDIQEIINQKPAEKKVTSKLAKNDFYPPGFRKGNVIHAIIAIPIYLLMTYYSMVLEIKNVTHPVLIFERCWFTICWLFVVAISCNYLGVHKIIPLTNHSNRLIRILPIILVNFIGVIFIICIMLSLESLIF